MTYLTFNRSVISERGCHKTAPKDKEANGG